MKTSCKYGSHRVKAPKGALPQAADSLDNTPVCGDNECLIDVKVLNIDSASFQQIKTVCNHDEIAMATMIKDIVNTRGKMQNPVTGSGGMLMGSVREVGPDFHDPTLQPGTPIATLVSLTLTPLVIEEITAIVAAQDQVHIKGTAVLFDSGIYAVLPEDLDETLVLSALDVAGAPPQMARLAKEGDTVFVLGAAGKSGLLCLAQARRSVGATGKVIGLVNEPAQKTLLESLCWCDTIILADAQDALTVYEAVREATAGAMVDLSVNVVNVGDTEMTSMMVTKDGGTVYFFSMATSFQKAALGAEGIGKDITMIIGNGYAKGHADFTLDLVRTTPKLLDIFKARYTKS
ncbi:MAG: zinc-binding alcohol dehydrogenase family protein [Acholeplasmatales bacterium]|nr:MAG: zinc-binding alcohol dehydrogenase family protein [Acholeplasmatales bacterium]